MSCSRIILHIGMDKTGSSSIRSSLSKRLRDPAVHYVQPAGNLNASKALAEAFMADPTRYITHRLSGLKSEEVPPLRAKALESLEVEFDKASDRTAVLSAEAVSRFNQADCTRIASFLDSKCTDVIVVAYIRRPKGYMESHFQQGVKSGQRSLVPKNLLPEYKNRFEAIDTAFGPDRVKYRLFDPSRFPKSDVLLDFCQEFGIDFGNAQSVRANEGLSRGALSLLFCYRKFGRQLPPSPIVPKVNQQIYLHLSQLRGAKFRLHSELVMPVIEAQRPSIEWMSRRLGEPLTEDLRAHDADAVRSEDDLLNVHQNDSLWLARQMGPSYEAAWRSDINARELAGWVSDWIDRLSQNMGAAGAGR